jgi:copper(I)-binding protein
MIRFPLLSACLFSLLSFYAVAGEEVEISNAWTRATAPGQQVGASYMVLTSKSDLSLEKAESTAAGNVEIHSMTMKNGVMQMRMLDRLPLKANQPEKLEPGGFHLMLFDLKKPLKAGESVDFTLHFKDSAGKTTQLQISSPVKRTADQ